MVDQPTSLMLPAASTPQHQRRRHDLLRELLPAVGALAFAYRALWPECPRPARVRALEREAIEEFCREQGTAAPDETAEVLSSTHDPVNLR